MPPVVALLSDFGTGDAYVGAMKGAVLCACPDACLVDVVHDLAPHDVRAAAFALAGVCDAFPAGTVFLAAVDAEAATGRRGLVMDARHRRFVGPDNGLFTLVLRDDAGASVHAITNQGLFRHRVAPTFQARDVFAPIAGRLASAMPLAEAGPQVQDPVTFAIEGPREIAPRVWEAPVLHVDRFGNLVSAFRDSDLEAILAGVGGDPTEVVVVVEGVVMPLVRAYADVAEGEACALLGGAAHLEVAVNRGSAARVLGASVGAPVRVRRL